MPFDARVSKNFGAAKRQQMSNLARPLIEKLKGQIQMELDELVTLAESVVDNQQAVQLD